MAAWTFISNEMDRMSWVGQMHKIQMVVNEIYKFISNPTPSAEDHIWLQKSLDWEFPLKLKCFGWLALHDKILTWEILSCRYFLIQVYVLFVCNIQRMWHIFF